MTVLRYDGRAANELRPLSCEVGLLHQADGSAQFMQGKTTVLVGIYGPGESKATKDEEVHQATLLVHCEGLLERSDLDKQYEEIVTEVYHSVICLDQFPRAAITITIQIFCNEGSVLGCLLNAVNLALLDANIPMKTSIYTLSAGIARSKGNDILLDLSDREEEKKENLMEKETREKELESVEKVERIETTQGQWTMSYTPKGEIIFVQGYGLKQEEYFKVAEICYEGTKTIESFIRETLKQRDQRLIP